MAYVVTGRCIGERYAACAQVCPCGSFHFGTQDGAPLMVINPETCIDCGSCLAECPVGAIVDSPEEAPDWAEFNRAASEVWPVAVEHPDDWTPRDPAEPRHGAS